LQHIFAEYKTVFYSIGFRHLDKSHDLYQLLMETYLL